MTDFKVKLGVDRAARPTGTIVSMVVRARDALSAAILAEAKADSGLDDPETMYTHAVSVEPMEAAPAAMAMAA